MANSPFNQKQWRADDELTDNPRWAGYDDDKINIAKKSIGVIDKLIE